MSVPPPRQRSWGRRVGSVTLDTRPLRIPAYRRLWASTVVTSIGTQLTAVAVPKQVFDLTGSSGYVGLTGAVGLVPLLVFGLWGGAVADTVDRRALLLVTNAGIALVSVLFWVQAFLHVGSVWLVLGLLGLNQALFAVNMPTRSAAVARLVPAELLPSAVALGSTTMLFGMVCGPLLAGVLLPVVGLATLYLVDACTLVAALAAVARMPALPPSTGSSRAAGLRDILDGFRYLSAKKVLLASFLVDIVAMVFGMPRALFPEMAERTFGDPVGGGLALGWLYAAIPIGAVACGLLSGWAGRIRRQGRAVVLAVGVWGLAVIGFGLADALWLAVLFLAVGGAADFVSMVFRSAMLQTDATDSMRGRMQGVFTVVVAGGPFLADLLHGGAAAVVGTSVAAWAGGVGVLLCTALAVAALPSFWRYRPAPAGPDAPTPHESGHEESGQEEVLR